VGDEHPANYPELSLGKNVEIEKKKREFRNCDGVFDETLKYKEIQ
jgi:hypothetical protein